MSRHIGPTIGDTIDQVTPVTVHGWQAYLHVTAVNGGDITVTFQDSADGQTWADLGASDTFTGPGTQALTGGPTVRRYLRAKSDGTFADATFVANFIRGEAPPAGPIPVSAASGTPSPDRSRTAPKPAPKQVASR